MPEKDDLDQQVDELLNDVDSLTSEVVADASKVISESPESEINPDKPIQDDAGLSDESPLIQDGEKIESEDIVSDVDYELNHMEKLINQLADPDPKNDPFKAEGQQVQKENYGDEGEESEDAIAQMDAYAGSDEESNFESEEDNIDDVASLIAGEPENFSTSTDEDIPDINESQQEASTEINDSDELVEHAAVGAAEEEDEAEKLLNSLDDVEEQEADEQEDNEQKVDEQEDIIDPLADLSKKSDEDSKPEPADNSTPDFDMDMDLDNIPDLDIPSPEPPKSKPADTEKKETTGILPQSSFGQDDLETISLWRITKLRVLVRLRFIAGYTGNKIANMMVGILEKLNKPFRNLSQWGKELIGFCALGTLVMATISLIIAVIKMIF